MANLDVGLTDQGQWCLKRGINTLAVFKSNREAWLAYDKAVNAPINKQQASSDWAWWASVS